MAVFYLIIRLGETGMLCKFSVLPKGFSKLDSIFCCKAVPGVGVTVFAGILSDKELKGRGWGRGGEVNKLS